MLMTSSVRHANVSLLQPVLVIQRCMLDTIFWVLTHDDNAARPMIQLDLIVGLTV